MSRVLLIDRGVTKHGENLQSSRFGIYSFIWCYIMKHRNGKYT